MDTSVMAVLQPQLSQLVSAVFQFLGATLVGFGIWLINIIRLKIRGNVVGETLFNLAMGWLQKKAEDPKTEIDVKAWLMAHKPKWITQADIDAGMRGAMQKAIVTSNGSGEPVVPNP